MPGLFIVFEGPDGAGTTTQARFLMERLQRERKNVVLTREPTDGRYGQKIREMLDGGEGISTELQQLFALDRQEHLELVILPGLKEGKVVISDRYVPSTLVYGEAQGLPLEWLQNLNKNFIQPDLLFLLLPPFEVSWNRVAKRKARDSFEQEQFQRKVYEGYEKYAREHPEVIVIDTSGMKEESAEMIWRAVERFVKNKQNIPSPRGRGLG